MPNHTHSIKPKSGRKRFVGLEIIIPAAGFGARLKLFGPKILVELQNQVTLLEYHINIINTVFPTARVIVVGGFQCDKLFNACPNEWICIENERYETTNVIRSLAMGLRASTSRNILIIYGDLVYNQQALTTMKTGVPSVLVGQQLMGHDEVGCIVNNGLINNIGYDLTDKWGQICFLTGRELELFKQFCYDRFNENKFGFEALNYVVSQGGNLRAKRNDKAFVYDIDSIKDLQHVNEVLFSSPSDRAPAHCRDI